MKALSRIPFLERFCRCGHLENMHFLTSENNVKCYSGCSPMFCSEEAHVSNEVLRMKAELLDRILACSNPMQMLPLMREAEKKIAIALAKEESG